MPERVDWKTAPPLWRAALDGAVPLERPAILRFATDDFAERLQAHLANGSRTLNGYVARFETWQDEAVGLPVVAGAPTLKLYQPTHGRFYLVTAGLVCARYGLPDRAVGGEEAVFFVLRRLEPSGTAPVNVANAASYHEFAWTTDAGGRWVAANGDLADGEDRLPLFPMTYVESGRRRRLLGGLVPVSARERYENAVVPSPIPSNSPDPGAFLAPDGMERLEAVIVGFKSLLEGSTTKAVPAVGAAGHVQALEAYREAFYFTVLDLAVLIHDDLSAVWNGLATNTTGEALKTRLAKTARGTVTWKGALQAVYAHHADPKTPGPPAPLSIMDVAAITQAINVLGVDTATQTPPVPPTVTPSLFSIVKGALVAAAEAVASAAAAAKPSAREPREATFTNGAVYVAKCVYERPKCPPSHRVTISRPSEVFQLAHFYDPDAPFRETRIAMPVDTSLAGLRKFPNSVKVAISSQLRKQMSRVQDIKLKKLDDGELEPEQPFDLGMVCSLSIPIITICALILLMVIVSLLNIVFFWQPLFKICKPKVG